VCSEQERTLEELGGQLSAAKLAAAELREAADNAQQQQQQQQQSALQEGSVTWANDRMVTQCKGCSREFNMTRRKVIKLFNCSHTFVTLLSCFLSLSNFPRQVSISLASSLKSLPPSSLLSSFVYPIYSQRWFASAESSAKSAARNCSIIPAVRKITAYSDTDSNCQIRRRRQGKVSVRCKWSGSWQGRLGIATGNTYPWRRSDGVQSSSGRQDSSRSKSLLARNNFDARQSYY